MRESEMCLLCVLTHRALPGLLNSRSKVPPAVAELSFRCLFHMCATSQTSRFTCVMLALHSINREKLTALSSKEDVNRYAQIRRLV
jgi:hypothetical protein